MLTNDRTSGRNTQHSMNKDLIVCKNVCYTCNNPVNLLRIISPPFKELSQAIRRGRRSSSAKFIPQLFYLIPSRKFVQERPFFFKFYLFLPLKWNLATFSTFYTICYDIYLEESNQRLSRDSTFTWWVSISCNVI